MRVSILPGMEEASANPSYGKLGVVVTLTIYHQTMDGTDNKPIT